MGATEIAVIDLSPYSASGDEGPVADGGTAGNGPADAGPRIAGSGS